MQVGGYDDTVNRLINEVTTEMIQKATATSSNWDLHMRHCVRV